MANYTSKYYYKFPIILKLLQFENRNGRKVIFRFTNKAKLYGCYNPRRDIIIVAKDIANFLIDKKVDKLIKIEYIRYEKRWKKYFRYVFMHLQDRTEKIYMINPDTIRIVGRNKLWGFQKIQDEEVE